MKIAKEVALVLVLAVTACAAATPLLTASGKPEVMVKGKTQQEVIDQLAAGCASDGRMVDTQTTSMVTCSFQGGAALQVLAGGGSGSTLVKHQYVASKQLSGVKVIMSNAWTESSNGFGGVTRYPLDISHGQMAQQFQAVLIRMTGGESLEKAK